MGNGMTNSLALDRPDICTAYDKRGLSERDETGKSVREWMGLEMPMSVYKPNPLLIELAHKRALPDWPGWNNVPGAADLQMDLTESDMIDELCKWVRTCPFINRMVFGWGLSGRLVIGLAARNPLDDGPLIETDAPIERRTYDAAVANHE